MRIALVFAAALILASVQPAAASFQFTKIVDTATPIPGGGGALFSFNNSDVPAIDNGQVVFDTSDMTIWRAAPDGSNLATVLTTADKIPDHWGRFQQYFGSSVQLAGDTLVIAADNCGGCGNAVGLFARDISGGRIRKLVDQNDTNQNFSGDNKNYGGFSGDFRVNGNEVVFTNRQNAFAVLFKRHTVISLAGDQDGGGSPPQPYCCLFSEPSIGGTSVFLRGSNIFGRSALETESRTGDPTTFKFITSSGTHPPHTPPNYLFNDFDFWNPVADNTNLIFGGASGVSGVPSIYGIYLADTNGNLKRLVDSNTAIPGGSGTFGTFQWSGNNGPIVAANGLVLFGASDANGNEGLYAVHESGGTVSKIVAAGDPIGGHTVASLNIGRQALSGTTLVFAVNYSGFQGSGLYSADLSSLLQ